MLGLFVINTWTKFYKNGMKTWEIRSYPIEYRGPILIIESKSNKIICQMDLIDCIPLTKELWEMNFEKHRTSCSFEDLPYNKNEKIAYAWILKDPKIFEENITITRIDKRPYLFLDDKIIINKKTINIERKNERIACKFINNTMFLYWMKKNYFALIGIVDLISGQTNLVLDEIKEDEIEYIISQLC